MDAEKKEKLHKRWIVLCRRIFETSGYHLDAERIINKWWEILNGQYSETHRAYHTWDHIYECFKEFDEVVNLFDYPISAELAIFFHDAVYNPNSQTSTNEQNSANLLRDFCRHIGLTNDWAADYVICTDHDPKRTEFSHDSLLICSIDLAILGADEMKYVLYAHGIRQEYKDVPLEVYRAKRAEILEGFLKRDRIFLTEHFHAKYEQQARDNLAWEIKVLRAGQFPET